MRLFLSWSGEMAKEVALELNGWLPLVIQAVRPFVSENIDKGARAMDVIGKELEQSDFGILLLTPENQREPWINFEAGALSKHLESARVASVLFAGLKKGAVVATLGGFQLTYPERDDFWRLVQTLNAALGSAALDPHVLSTGYDTYWERLERAFNDIQGRHAGAPAAAPAPREKLDLVADGLVELRQAVEAQQALLRRLVPREYSEAEARRWLKDSPASMTVSASLGHTSIDVRKPLPKLQGVVALDESTLGTTGLRKLIDLGTPGVTRVTLVDPAGGLPQTGVFVGPVLEIGDRGRHPRRLALRFDASEDRTGPADGDT